MKYIFFLILTTLAIFSCNSPQVSKKYLLECYARFDEQTSKTTAEASLREGDTNPIAVEPPGGIHYQQAEMNLVPVHGMIYQYSYPSHFMKEHLFQWKSERGKPLEYTLRMASLDSVQFEPRIISRHQPARFSWKGTPLERGEALVFIWENEAKHLTIPMEMYNIGNATSIEFPSVKISEIPAGDWTYYVVRKKLQKATIGDITVSGISEYYTSPKAVKVF